MNNTNNLITNELRVLNLLKEKYESDGFTFLAHPSKAIAPLFLKSYRPDAIAIKDDSKVVIEVKSKSSPRHEKNISNITALFQNEDEWKLEIYYTSDFPHLPLQLPVHEFNELEGSLTKAENLSQAGFKNESFLALWITLEAIARKSTESLKMNILAPQKPASSINALETQGLIDHSTGRTLRKLIRLRNALVHGDLSLTIADKDLNKLHELATVTLTNLRDL